MKYIVLFALFAIALGQSQDYCFQYTFDSYYFDAYVAGSSDFDGWYSYNTSSQTYYFTTSSCETQNSPCPAGASVCMIDSPSGTVTVLGTFDQITSSMNDDASGFSIVSVGDGCSKSSIFVMCNSSADNVISVSSEGCYTDITFSSASFCPDFSNGYVSESWVYWNHGGVFMFAIIFSLIVSGLCIFFLTTLLIVGCYKCCTDKKSKKRENIMLQNTKVAFQKVPTDEPASPVQYIPVSPFHPMNQLPNQMQFVQQPMFFQPIVPQSQPAQIGQTKKPTQMEEDEKLARQLQAELNGN